MKNTEIVSFETNLNLWNTLLLKFEVPLQLLKLEDLKKIFFVPVVKRLGRLSIDNYLMRFFEEINFPSKSFRLIPGFPSYAITKKGVLVNILKRFFPIYRLKDSGYPCTDVYTPSLKSSAEVVIHRLVALAWVENLDPVKNWQVNHKDGDKQNFNYCNLEWVSPKSNIQHGHDNGLYGLSTEVKVFDIELQKEYSFKSLSEMNGAFGFKIKVSDNVASFKDSLYRKRYEIRKGEDKTPWQYLGITKPKKAARYVITIKNGKDIIETINGIEDFSEKYIYSKSLTLNSVKNIHHALETARGLWPDLYFTVEDRMPPVIYQAKNLCTGEILSANSMDLLAKLTNVDKRLIRNILKTEKFYDYNNFIFKKGLETQWMEPKERKKPLVKILALNEVTNEELIFNNVSEACRVLKIRSSISISSRLNTSKSFKNYVFKTL